MYCSLFYVIPSTIGKQHYNFRAQIAQHFNIDACVKKDSPPHITLKYDFQATEEQLLELEHALEMFCEQAQLCSLQLHGLNHFDRKTIFVDVTASMAMIQLHHNLMEMLQSISWMQFRNHELEHPPHFHATLARKQLNENNFDAVWKFCQQHRVDVKLPFNNIAMCPIVNGKRVIRRMFFIT